MLHRSVTSILLFWLAALPVSASTARLLGPGSSCLGVAGTVAEGAALGLEACSDAADQVWELPPRGYSGPVRLAGFCLDGAAAAPRLAACAEGDPFQVFRHDGDGQLAVAGRCLDAGPGLGLAPCTGADGQLFFAEGHNAWTPPPASLYGAPLPIPTRDPAVWYSDESFALRRSENGGRTYGALRQASESDNLTVSPFDSNLLWFASPEVERSEDGGLSWLPVLQLRPETAGTDSRVVASLRDPERVYAFGTHRLWASHDGGRSFELRGPLPSGGLSGMQLFHLGGGQLLFLRVVHCLFECPPEGLGVWRSSDEGASWQQVASRESSSVGVGLLDDPFRPETFYLKLRPTADAVDSLLRSQDGGLTFEPFAALPSRDGTLLADRERNGQLYLVQGEKLWRSRDGGASWQGLSSPLSGLAIYDSQACLFAGSRLRLAAQVQTSSPFDRSTVYFDSADGGDSFTRIDALGIGRPNPQPVPVVVTSRRDRLYFRDNFNLRRSDDGGRSWQPGSQAYDMLELAADPREPSTLFARHSTETLWRSVDAGATLTPISPPAAVSALGVFAHGGQTVVLAASFPSFYRSVDGGSSWTPLPSPQPAQHFLKLVADGGAVYAVTDQAELYRSLDGGLTFLRRGTAEASLAAGGGLLAYRPYAEAKIRVSTDGGVTFADRFPPETGNLTVGADGVLYVAGGTTVLRSRDGGRTWRSLGRDQIAMSAAGPALTIDPFDSAKLYHSGALGVWLGRWDETSALDLGQRFEARLRWRDYLGQTGEGLPQALTSDTGLFWLFTPERAEVSVKLLDGRAINGRFWVFLASMTDVELDLEVRDRVSGELWTYHNPLGRLLSFGDIEAFPQGDPQPATAFTGPFSGSGWLHGAGTPVVVDERFEIEVEWNTGAATGLGLGRSLNHDSAAFYFFHPANVEILVNVLDGRPINGKFWVYFGSLSDVEYTVRVKDRVGGTTKTYFNPAGRFASVSDTEAFE